MNTKEFEANLQFLSDQDLDDLARDFADRFDFTEDKVYTAEEIEDIFNYHKTLQVLGNFESSAKVFDSMKAVIDKFHADRSDLDKGLDFLADWSFMAMNYTKELKDDFVCLPFYEEVLGAFRDAPGKFRVKEIKVKLQMAHHFRYWLADNGNIDALEEDLKHFLTKLIEQYPSDVEKIIEERKAAEEWDNAMELSRALYRFYLHGSKPNEAIKFLKETILLIPKTTDYVKADSADCFLLLGRIYGEHGKWETARKYFEKSLEIYSSLGEEFEMFTAQAEGWIDEAKKMMS